MVAPTSIETKLPVSLTSTWTWAGFTHNSTLVVLAVNVIDWVLTKYPWAVDWNEKVPKPGVDQVYDDPALTVTVEL